jgi:ribosomal protein S18 acetylase RimI-like enzyme
MSRPTLPTLRLVRADRVPAQRLHRAFGAAFADYLIGPFTLALDQWPRFLARQGVDLASSRVALDGEQPLAFALVAPRPDIGRWRLATMGALPAARGSGAAPMLLDDVVERARASGAAGVELEVFARNERAVRLYRGRGFEELHALHGYDGGTSDPVPPESVQAQAKAKAVECDAAWAWLAEAMREVGDLPLQVTPASLSAIAAPLQAWRAGSAQLVLADDAGGSMTVHSLVDRDARQADAQSLVEGLLARHPGRDIKVPALQRSDLGGDALRRTGFRVQPLHQWLMLRPL